MAAIVEGLYMEGFAMIDMKELQDISDEGYVLSCNGDACFAYL